MFLTTEQSDIAPFFILTSASTLWESVLCSLNITSNLPTVSAIASMAATLFLLLSILFTHSFSFCLLSTILTLVWKCVASLGIARCASQATASGVLPAWVHRSPLPSSCPKETPFLFTTRPVTILYDENMNLKITEACTSF